MKLFQIEEPEGGPADPDMPGAAVGIDASGAVVVVATAVGGNAAVLADRDGFEMILPVPAVATDAAAWRELFEGARLRAERTLARPVTHAVLVVGGTPDDDAAASLRHAAAAAGLGLLRLIGAAAAGADPALAAAVLAEELAPRVDLA